MKQSDEIIVLRAKARDLISDLIPDLISAEDAARLLGVSAMTIYRWKSDSGPGFFMPRYEEINKILNFVDEVRHVEDGWKELAATWRRFDEIPLTIQEILFHPQLRKVLDSDQPIEGKIKRLTKLTFKIKARG